MSLLFNLLEKYVDSLDEIGYLPDKKPITTSPSLTEIEVDKTKIVNFASNNYLSIANHPEVKEAVINAITKFGLGTGASRWMAGTCELHKRLENKIARFKGFDEAIIFSSGTLANMGAISQLVKPALLPVLVSRGNDVFGKNKIAVFFDEANHASLYDAYKLVKGKDVKFYLYKRCDPESLETKLKKSKESCKLIITDGIFSDMGNIAPLKEIYKLAKEYDCILVVDDAHSTGVLGKHGKGTFEYWGLDEIYDDENIVVTGTFSKAVGSEGGFVTGHKKMVRLLRTARQYIFNTAMPPAIAAGSLKSLEIIEREPERREKLHQKCDYLRQKIAENGYDYLGSPSQIIPILVGNEDKAEKISEILANEGIYVPCFKYPAVPRNKAIFRLSLMYDHTREQIDTFIDKLNELMEKFGERPAINN